MPLVIDLAKTDEQRQILKLIFARQVMGRPFLAPPGMPADRAAALRKAFMETMKDKEFLADAEKAQIEIKPVAGEKLEEAGDEVYATADRRWRKRPHALHRAEITRVGRTSMDDKTTRTTPAGSPTSSST